jgi:Na+/H+ antiporter NhaD/arsenite permease-like protein
MASDENGSLEETGEVLYNITAVVIFIAMTGVFLFPMTDVMPIDRRTMSVFAATCCFLSRSFMFGREKQMDVLSSIDWDVILLLAAIMVINFLVVRQVLRQNTLYSHTNPFP